MFIEWRHEIHHPKTASVRVASATHMSLITHGPTDIITLAIENLESTSASHTEDDRKRISRLIARPWHPSMGPKPPAEPEHPAPRADRRFPITDAEIRFSITNDALQILEHYPGILTEAERARVAKIIAQPQPSKQ